MLAFVTAALVILMTPGPTNTLLAAYGAVFGFRRATVLVLAEACGYLLAVSVVATLAQGAAASGAGLVLLKLTAALWLLLSARKLWSSRFAVAAEIPARAFRRVLLTTLLNPKAMIVGLLLIPPGGFAGQAPWIAGYGVLSATVGLIWVAVGSRLPSALRNNAYRMAAVILGGFSIAAAASALSS